MELATDLEGMFCVYLSWVYFVPVEQAILNTSGVGQNKNYIAADWFQREHYTNNHWP